jgi:predicted N-acyltransferase
VQIDDLACGSPVFSDESFLEKMYSMYENVFRQSEIQFDVLTKSFFRALLQDRKRGGKVFLYWVDGHLIGYNICFVHNKRLIDKYIGFEYPAAREANLYFLSWFHNLKFALEQGLEFYVAGWTDPAVKKSLGATFTLTHHAVYIRNPLLRAILKPIKHLFESDSDWVESHAKP